MTRSFGRNVICLVLILSIYGCTDDRAKTVPSVDAAKAVPVDAMIIDAAPPPDPLAHQTGLQPTESILINVCLLYTSPSPRD